MQMQDTTEYQPHRNRAWLLDFGQGLQAAVAYHEMSQILLEESIFAMPCAPAYCRHVLLQKNRILPVMDMVKLLHPEQDLQERPNIIGLAVFQSAPYEPLEYVGFYLNTTPVSIPVHDEQFCDLPEEPLLWRSVSLSCFEYKRRPVPIIDLGHLFSAQLRRQLNEGD